MGGNGTLRYLDLGLLKATSALAEVPNRITDESWWLSALGGFQWGGWLRVFVWGKWLVLKCEKTIQTAKHSHLKDPPLKCPIHLQPFPALLDKMFPELECMAFLLFHKHQRVTRLQAACPLGFENKMTFFHMLEGS